VARHLSVSRVITQGAHKEGGHPQQHGLTLAMGPAFAGARWRTRRPGQHQRGRIKTSGAGKA
jgi:hypothetical protein